MRYSLCIVLLLSFVALVVSPSWVSAVPTAAEQARVSIASDGWGPLGPPNDAEYTPQAQTRSIRGPDDELLEQPPAAFLEAVQALEQNPDLVRARVLLIQAEVDRNNDKNEADRQEEFERGIADARGDTRAIAAAASDNAGKESYFRRNAFQEAYHLVLQETFLVFGGKDPVINWTNTSELRPGSAIRIRGVNFGSAKATVFMEVQAGYTVELEIWDWTPTEIRARMSPFVTALRPYSGALWIRTSDQRMSPPVACQFVPWAQIWWGKGNWISKSGGLFGGKKDGIFLKGVSLGDPDFYVDHREREHAGDGWSKFTAPDAGGQSLGQGYHIGVAAFGGAKMRIHYYVRGPKDIAFPATPGLGPVGAGSVTWVLWQDEQPPSTQIVGGW